MSAAEPTNPPLPWPEAFQLAAAEGWIELGNLDEARAELEQIGLARRQHPAVLAVECQLLMAGAHWDSVVAVAEHWVERAPGRPEAWIQRSYALHELRRTREAWDKLLPAATLFPRDTTIAYNLGCYACQLGEMDAARRWLRQSLRLCPEAARVRWKASAMRDPDLAPLREELARDRLG
jgi:Flp pilus assembly protein TadD